MERSKNSIYLTGGWFGSDQSIDKEYQRMVEKYDEDTADDLIEMMYQHYKYLTFVDTGSYSIDDAKNKVELFQEKTGLEVNQVPGPCGALHKMARLELDDDFIVVPAGEMVTAAHFGLAV